MMAGSAMQAYGSYQQGQAAKDAADYNVALGDIQAKDVAKQAETEKDHLARAFAQERGAGIASTGASGVRIGTGSSLDWENDLISTFIEDRAAIDENTARTVYGIRNQQTLDASQGSSAATAGKIGAGSSLLAGAGKASAQWYTPKKKVA
jgi:hypothetical protein